MGVRIPFKNKKDASLSADQQANWGRFLPSKQSYC